ncbi:ubiquitin-conjugating enzyme [Ophiostoma piceae UAMH 11346]|uniref:Ubiquitin-conjugating enzyme n=1 Tax=Ophiostoma piceae (strain UAMH 11346) TaxID=1262450 RepID=S3C7B0_OPHP1|nr:ubiquitin-conjugating enzyme [Ophiostoma piceae UAMH 11346]
MSNSKLASLPSLRRQTLLAEFSGLKQACPEGVFVSLTPGDPSLWSGVIFVHNDWTLTDNIGPYAPAVLRFQISFPDTYPDLPPLVTFSTDIFHPLIASLTNHMSGPQEGGTAHAPDEERLPPGGFSLRHGFPAWFGRGNRSASGRQSQLAPQTPPRPSSFGSAQSTPNSAAVSPFAKNSRAAAGGSMTSGTGLVTAASTPTPSYLRTRPAATDISTYDVLDYLRSAFDDPSVLDSVPLEAAGDPNAWHAWRTHQRQQGKVLPETGGDVASAGSPSSASAQASEVSNPSRSPGDWNWEHVWENRVREGINNSLSDPVLFGSAGAADDVIRFLSMEDGDVETIKENLKRTLGAPVS